MVGVAMRDKRFVGGVDIPPLLTTATSARSHVVTPTTISVGVLRYVPEDDDG